MKRSLVVLATKNFKPNTSLKPHGSSSQAVAQKVDVIKLGALCGIAAASYFAGQRAEADQFSSFKFGQDPSGSIYKDMSGQLCVSAVGYLDQVSDAFQGLMSQGAGLSDFQSLTLNSAEFWELRQFFAKNVIKADAAPCPIKFHVSYDSLELLREGNDIFFLKSNEGNNMRQVREFYKLVCKMKNSTIILYIKQNGEVSFSKTLAHLQEIVLTAIELQKLTKVVELIKELLQKSEEGSEAQEEWSQKLEAIMGQEVGRQAENTDDFSAWEAQILGEGFI